MGGKKNCAKGKKKSFHKGKWNLNYLGCQLLCTWLPQKFKTAVDNTTVAGSKAEKSILMARSYNL